MDDTVEAKGPRKEEGVLGEGAGMEKQRCLGASEAWEKGTVLEVQIGLEGKKRPLWPFCQVSGCLSFRCHCHQAGHLKFLTAFNSSRSPKAKAHATLSGKPKATATKITPSQAVSSRVGTRRRRWQLARDGPESVVQPQWFLDEAVELMTPLVSGNA